jgi:predicted nucleic acid-binding Zn ribbon protein
MAKMAKAETKSYPLKERRSLEERAKNEPDPDWRRFFMEVKHKQSAEKKKAASFVFREYEKDGLPQKVARNKTQPEALKKFLKTEVKNTGSKLAHDLEWLREMWPKLVGAEVAAETEVYAFKNGTLTISVHNSPLLQEIRQFHGENIFLDLRDVWQGSMPLLKITYRAGKK